MSFLDTIKKYQLSSLLEISTSLSQKLYNNEKPIVKISRYDQSRFVTGGYKLAGSFHLVPWFLVDISYYAIKCSNDFRARIISEYEFMNIYNDFLGFDRQLTSSQYAKYDDADKLFYILFGLSQKSFWFQELGRLLDMNQRFYDLLCGMPKRNTTVPQFYRKVEIKYGIDFETYNLSASALWWIASTNLYYQFPYNIDPKLKARNIDNDLLRTMLLDYIADYSSIRNSTLGATQLHLTPVVRTNKNEMLIISTFLIAKKALTNLYWETRNIYRKDEGKELNEMLGYSFEIYVDELLAYYLPKDKYQRLPERRKQKMADLVITTRNYKIITEQKFSMLNISLQDALFDLEKMDSWLEAYTQAAKQLGNTAQQIEQENRVIIKLILFFDELFIADGLIKERIMKLCKERGMDTIDLNNIFMINIGDYEMLIQTIANNEDLFNKVIGTKIERENNKNYSQGVEFNQIFQEYGITENEYMKTKALFGR